MCDWCLQEGLKGTYYLWQLFHAKQEEEKAEAERTELAEELQQAAKELKAAEAAVKEKKREAASLAKQRQALEQKMRKKRAEVDKKVKPLAAKNSNQAMCHSQKTVSFSQSFSTDLGTAVTVGCACA